MPRANAEGVLTHGQENIVSSIACGQALTQPICGVGIAVNKAKLGLHSVASVGQSDHANFLSSHNVCLSPVY